MKKMKINWKKWNQKFKLNLMRILRKKIRKIKMKKRKGQISKKKKEKIKINIIRKKEVNKIKFNYKELGKKKLCLIISIEKIFFLLLKYL